MGQSASTRRDQDLPLESDMPIFSHVRRSPQPGRGPSAASEESSTVHPPLSGAHSNPVQLTDAQHPPTQSFATFSRQISASSIPLTRGRSVHRESTSRRDAIFYEQREERPLVHMEDLGMRNAPITHITASPMPRQSRLSRFGSMIIPRDHSDQAEPRSREDQPLRRTPHHRDPLEATRERQRNRNHRTSFFGSSSSEAPLEQHESRRRSLVPISRPFPLSASTTLPSPFLNVSPTHRGSIQRNLATSSSSTARSVHREDHSTSRLARIRRSLTLPVQFFSTRNTISAHERRTQLPPQSPIRDVHPDSEQTLLPALRVADSPANSANIIPEANRTTSEEQRPLGTPTIPQSPETIATRTNSSGWMDRWVDRSSVGRREGRRVSNIVGGRSNRLVRRDHDGALPRILSLAAVAIAAQLTGSNERTPSDLQAVGQDDLDGSLQNLFRTLQTTMPRGTVEPAAGEAGQGSGPSSGSLTPLNYLRVFRFVSRPASAARHSDGLTREDVAGRRASDDQDGAGAPSADPEGRTVTLIVVGVRSVPSEENLREETPVSDSGLDSLLELPPLTRSSNLLGGGAGGLLRHANGRSRFSHHRRASSGGFLSFPANYDSQRHQRTLSTSRPTSYDARPASESSTPSTILPLGQSDSPAGPHPPPSTPADPGLSAYSSQAPTPSRRPSSASAIQQPPTPPQDSGVGHLREVVNSATEDLPIRGVQQRRRSASEFARQRDLGAGAARRNGVIAPEDADAATPAIPGSRSWLIYVVGTNLSEDHPALTAPSLFTDNPSYEDMLLVSSLLGPAKPPVASPEDIAFARGLFRVCNHGVGLAAEGLQDNGLVQICPGERCLVCLEEYRPREELRRLNECSHLFHRECIDEWLTTGRNSCPLCRGQGVAKERADEQLQL